MWRNTLPEANAFQRSATMRLGFETQNGLIRSPRVVPSQAPANTRSTARRQRFVRSTGTLSARRDHFVAEVVPQAVVQLLEAGAEPPGGHGARPREVDGHHRLDAPGPRREDG